MDIEKMKNFHTSYYGGTDERSKKYQDYTIEQEKKDLKRYKNFLNSQTYDDVKEAEKKLDDELER